jgi:hypothetical protein
MALMAWFNTHSAARTRTDGGIPGSTSVFNSVVAAEAARRSRGEPANGGYRR